MWCLVCLPHAVNVDIEVDAKAKGQECLDKVCNRLGIAESDYFGLQFRCPRGEVLWLNMRNSIRQQVPGPQPLRLHLRVKFFVPPHLLLQEETRHQFYLNVKNDVCESRVLLSDQELAVLLSYISQAQWGDCPANLHPQQLALNNFSHSTLLPTNHPCHADQTFWNSVAELHKKLKGWGRTKSEYWLLKEASSLRSFGEDLFPAKNGAGGNVLLGIGPEGVNVYNAESKELIQRILYQSIHIATHTGKGFFLAFISPDDVLNSDAQNLEFRFDGTKTANGVYRAVTEKHAFYSCETVRRSVTSQFIRDLKGTIVSLFNENTALGKNYVFDVRHTCREVYDNARRKLHQVQNKNGRVLECLDNDKFKCNLAHLKHKHSSFEINDMEFEDRIENDCDSENDESCKSQACLDVREKLAKIKDAMLCRICMDEDIDTIFFPCRHVTCCHYCAILCELCPICRTSIENTQLVYLPLLNSKQCDETTNAS